MKTESKFNKYGHFLGEIPEQCWQDCSAPGQDAAEAVSYWRRKLEFNVPRENAIRYLRETGAWPLKSNEYDTGLLEMDDTDLACKVLWIACGDMREQGEWLGLCN